MRISVPTIPQSILSSPSSLPRISPAEAVERIASFIGPGNVTVLTGAGVSVDSGVKAYRGKDGRYMNPNYKCNTLDLVSKGRYFTTNWSKTVLEAMPFGEQRYWLRSYIGFPAVRDTLPNPTHFSLAALQHSSIVTQLVTQNVDGLHHKAARRVWDEERIRDHILELHGTLHKVHCNHGHGMDRNSFQALLSAANPQWAAWMDDIKKKGQKPKTNPDGDVVLEGVSYDDFVVPDCPSCMNEGRHNNVSRMILNWKMLLLQPSYKIIEECDRLFLMGTTLATYSAFRLLKHALELQKPVLFLNVGPTRADGIQGIEKLEIPSGLVMRDVVKAVVADTNHNSGTRATYDPALRDMLLSGVVIPRTDKFNNDDFEEVPPIPLSL
ncbi:hypothetical protein EW146_g5221 [Bondarzewia mesenterica]|uniref:Deacetylase sirtuin-type domain-containing protein n=1 Tax=Bondarzewia mesenterica TaxID=1095465 RepID=A0A4S4LU89_9AGAM|nr:hypothetical protein EW146_g5221 [Bondarzewia mesenterica]